MRYQTGTHELEKKLPLGTMKPAADSKVLFVNQSSIPFTRHWATQPGVSLGRIAPCSSSFKRYDSKDCLPNKPHCPQQVMITRKIDKVKWSPHSKIHHYFSPSPSLQNKSLYLYKIPLLLIERRRTFLPYLRWLACVAICLELFVALLLNANFAKVRKVVPIWNHSCSLAIGSARTIDIWTELVY